MLREKYRSIASVMRLQTAVSIDGKVEYCEFVVAAESLEELREEMLHLKSETCDIISDPSMNGLNGILNMLNA